MQEIGLGREDGLRTPLAPPPTPAERKLSAKTGLIAERGAASGAITRGPYGRRQRRYVILRQGLGAAFMIVIALVALLADKARLRKLTQLVPEIDALVAYSGFGIEQVTVKGQRYTLVADVFEALDLGSQRTFASFDATAAQARLEALPWVAGSELRRIYPNQLEVKIRERAAFAVWQQGNRTALIDENGSVLSEVASLDSWRNLPRIAGAGAAPMAKGFLASLSAHPGLVSRLREVERVGGRRWSVHLDENVTIHLPVSGAEAALEELVAWPGTANVLTTGHAVIDLRARGRIAVRPDGPVAPTSRAPKTIADLIQPAG